MTEGFISFNNFRAVQSRHLRFAKQAPPFSRKLRYLRRVGEGQSRGLHADRLLPLRLCLLLRTRYGRGISMAPTAYATAADEVSRSARL